MMKQDRQPGHAICDTVNREGIREARGVFSKGRKRMVLHCLRAVSQLPLVDVVNAVRACEAGDEVRVVTDIEALVADLKAFAHMSGNRLTRVEQQVFRTVVLTTEDGQHFVPDASGPSESALGWVVTLEVLATSQWASRSESTPRAPL